MFGGEVTGELCEEELRCLARRSQSWGGRRGCVWLGQGQGLARARWQWHEGGGSCGLLHLPGRWALSNPPEINPKFNSYPFTGDF